MKRVLLVAAATAAASVLAGQTSAQTLNGNVVVTGSVASKCSVVDAGTPGAGSDFGGTIALGALDAADGTLKTSLSGSTAGAAVGTTQFRVNCTKTGATVTLDANPLTTAGAATTGYTNSVAYNADLVANLASGGPDTFTNNTANPATSGTLSGALANAANNLTVKVYGLSTPAGAILVAGAYSGNVAVTVTPAT
jgi:hypothetical protein